MTGQPMPIRGLPAIGRRRRHAANPAGGCEHSPAAIGRAGAAVRGPSRKRLAARDLVLVLLTLGSGGVDAVCFFGLGQVFTSVMTGNLVLFGLAAGQGEGLAVLRSAVALAGYAVGGFVTARLLPRPVESELWPTSATSALTGVLALQAVVAAAWLALGGHPAGRTQYLLIAAYAVAMGTQSATVHTLAIPGVSTTYVTGTLTWVLAGLACGSAGRGHVGRRLSVVASVAVGAGCTSVLLLFSPVAAALFPLAATGIAVLTAVVGCHQRLATR
jgi:uncharacterized membrane protein YoaK (UPF0700 family)